MVTAPTDGPPSGAWSARTTTAATITSATAPHSDEWSETGHGPRHQAHPFVARPSGSARAKSRARAPSRTATTTDSTSAASPTPPR